jgi:dipeptidyl aminopeptidase/acylaminoacyl peptidase
MGVIMSAMIGMAATKATPVLDQPLTSPLPARFGTKVITPNWLLSAYQENTERPIVKWLDDTHILYTFPPQQANQKWTIELFDVRGGKHKVLGVGANPTPSPDGQWIAFTQGEKESKQLWITDHNGSNLKQLSHIEGGLNDYSFEFAWSPDSKYIALVHQPSFPYWEKKEPPQSTIDIINTTTGQSQHIASFDASIRSLSWFPNGKELLFVKERIGSLYNEEEDRDWIQSLDINDGPVRTLAEFDGLQQSLRPVSSPDGQWIAFMYDADNPTFNFMPSIGLIPNDSSVSNILPPITRLTHELKLYSPRWSPDSQRIYVLRDYGAYKQIYAIDAKTGEPSQITHAPLNIESYALSPDGAQLAWIGQDAQATRVLRVASSDGRNVKDLAIIPEAPKDMALSEVREVEWESPDYPARLRGLLFLPLNYREGTRYPLIVDIHGGGEGANIYLSGGILVSTPLEWQIWTAKGYAVFVPEFRSSASFGSLAITRDEFQEHDLINCDIKDIEAGVDSLIEKGIVDPHRIAAIGHSAGARRVNWLTATTHRFQAVISKEGWADEWIEAFSAPPLKRTFLMFGGAPWEIPQNYQKNSALFHCYGAATPTLFLMGNPELGGADPYNTVPMLYNAIKAQGVETEYVKYPDEGHVFEQQTNQRDALQRSIKWIDDHMGKKSK